MNKKAKFPEEARFQEGDLITCSKPVQSHHHKFESGTIFVVDSYDSSDEEYYLTPYFNNCPTKSLSFFMKKTLVDYFFMKHYPSRLDSQLFREKLIQGENHKFDVGDIISLERWDLNIHTKDLKITAHLDFEDKVEIIDYNDDNYIVILSNKDYGIEFEINIKDCERCFKKVSDEDTEENKENKIEEITNECINTLSKCIEALQKNKVNYYKL